MNPSSIEQDKDVNQPGALSVAAVARRFGVGKRSIFSAIHRGQLKATKIANRWLIPRAEVERVLAAAA